MAKWNWKGAKWWKFDFHTHTPASDDYGKGPNQTLYKQRTAKEWLLDYMRAGIDCVAVTDHNTGVWINNVQAALNILKNEKPEGFRDIYIYPGMEITVQGGIHVLAIFELTKTSSDMDALRGSVGFQGTPGCSNGVTKKSFIDVINEIVSSNGIAIPAHVDKSNGLFTLKGTTLEQALRCEKVFAMEQADPSYSKPQLYKDKNLAWTEILGSDAHHPSGDEGERYPGSHYTWVKMEEPCIEGLRLALMDGPLSIRRSDRVTEDPNRYAALTIQELKVSNARYLGRSEPFSLYLNPWLNTIIGGRGTGKSTSVEFIRNVLRREKELPKELEEEFEKYRNEYSNRDEIGLLTKETEISAIYRKDGIKYKIQWNTKGDLEPIKEYVDEDWQPAKGEIRHRFPVSIYSQKQIFHLAKSPSALLKIIDEAPEVDYQTWNKRWQDEEARFLSLRAEARKYELKLKDEAQLLGELDDVKRKLAIFEKTGHAEVLKNYQKRSRQQRLVGLWSESLSGIGKRIREISEDIVPEPLDESKLDNQLNEDVELIRIASETRNRLIALQNKLEEHAREAEQAFSEWQERKEKSSWNQAVEAALKAYDELSHKLQNEGAGDPSAFGELVQRRQTIEQSLQSLANSKEQLNLLNKQAKESLAKLLEIRRSLTGLRRKFIKNVLKDNKYVRIDVIPYGATETIEEEFRRLIQREGGGFEKDIESFLSDICNGNNCDSDIEKNLQKLKDNIKCISTEQSDHIGISDKRFITHIQKLPPEALDRLDLWFPEDSLNVQYCTKADGKKFRSIQEGSPGQKTAALLAFLLSYGEEPLILDQPEDDLDNHLIYNLIVNQLREVKQHRQVIVVTHNANIVVNGDAELVVALDAHGGETQKECEGSLQKKNVRETVCTVMEGGQEAFKQRYRRIALEKPYV